MDIKWRCDGDKDCDDNSDEESCETVCKETEWKCIRKEQCILAKWICDGEEDCHDGSDEDNCTYMVICTCMALQSVDICICHQHVLDHVFL